MEGYAKFPIPLGKKLKRSFDIKVFAWNGTDTNSIKVSLNLALGEELQPFNSQAVPIGKDIINLVISDPEVVFSVDDYNAETLTQLISLVGYRKMIVLISGSGSASPTEITNTFSFAGEAEILDLLLGTKSTIDFMVGEAGITGEAIYDWGSIASRHAKVKFQIQPSHSTTGLMTWSVKTFTSDDNIVWNLKSTTNGTRTVGTDPVTVVTHDDTLHSFRYQKLEAVFTNTGGSSSLSLAMFEVYDALKVGGTGALSFEILEPSSQQWIELLSASELGTITSGSAIKKQLGDVSTDVGSDKFNVALPSTQTDFRAKLIITGNLNIGVSILKVA